MPSTKISVGDRVVSLTTITEGGGGFIGDPDAKPLAKTYIHADPGDKGEVIHVKEEVPESVGMSPLVTVLWAKGTSTICWPNEYRNL